MTGPAAPSVALNRYGRRARARCCPVADKVSQPQRFWAIRLFDLSKLGHCVAWLSCIAEGAAGIRPDAPPGSGPPGIYAVDRDLVFDKSRWLAGQGQMVTELSHHAV